MKKKETTTVRIPRENTLLQDEIKTNIHCIDFAETYQLLFGSRERTNSFKYQLLGRLFEIYQEEFPLTLKDKRMTSRSRREAFLQGSNLTIVQEIDKNGNVTEESYETTYFHEKERFFSFDLFEKFRKDLIEGDDDGKGYIEAQLIYHKRGGLENVNKPDKCDREFQTGWRIKGEKEQLQFFFEMGKLAIEAYFLTKPGLSPGAPNQAWMDIFGFNEGVCSMLRKWFWTNLLCLPEENFGTTKQSSSIKTNNTFNY